MHSSLVPRASDEGSGIIQGSSSNSPGTGGHGHSACPETKRSDLDALFAEVMHTSEARTESDGDEQFWTNELDEPPMTGSIIIVNASSGPCHVFVSKYSYSQGDDSWFTLGPGQRDSWARNNWELVAFKNDGDSDRSGVYVRADTTVVYHSLHNVST
ncbi:hypothetical protein C8Q77DRAFT_1159822 [Trametes polyzona]|nr:hypothetical protein C8Q77DRAFT_1159822 [Trametes polyzona]